MLLISLTRQHLHRLALLFSLLLPLAGCGGMAKPATITVFAAASLTEAFAELASTFEEQQPGVEVQLNLAGSQRLAQQLVQGAPADLFASADRRQMAVAVAAGRIADGAPELFARNRLVVITPATNPAAIYRLADLARPGVKLVIAGEAVPAGHYARQVLTEAAADPAFGPSFPKAVLANVVSFEQNVRAVLTKVVLGEADAGIVYASDVGDAGLQVIPIPDSLNVHAVYPLAPVADSEQPELARAFARFILSPQGQQILVRHGLQSVSEQ